MPARTVEVAVVGGGVIGLSVAWRLARGGRQVAVFDRADAGRGASWAAAGMLAPAAEIGFEELALYRLGRESLRRWPAFAAALERASGQPVGYDATGTLVVAADRDDAEALRRLFRFQEGQGVPVEWLSGEAAREREPLLSPRLPAAVWSPEDHQVDNRAVVTALIQVVRATAALHEHTVVRAVEPGAARSALLLDDGSRVEAQAVVLAAGAWARRIGGLEPRPPVRPIKGQMLALGQAAPVALRHVVRGAEAYLAPKPGGRLVVGATSEEVGFDTRVTAGALYRLLEAAVELVPGVEELQWIEAWAGLRPAARDHAPLLGFAAPGVAYALGHYRHGVLLAPVTAHLVADAVEAWLAGSGAETSPWLAPFSPDRFEPRS